MTSVPQSSAKIDRLSSLPPELLLTIFDLAYDPDQLLLEPLSKRLLPYFQRNLYRQIRIPSLSSWLNLLETVYNSPAFGDLVLDLDTLAVYGYPLQGEFGNIIKPFPRLVSLKTGYIQPIRTSVDTALPPLQHLSYECEVLDLAAFDLLANLNLSTLEICFHYIDVISESFTATRSESIRSLSLELKADEDDGDAFEDHAWSSTPVNIVNCCPNITSLRLFDSTYPDYRDFLSSISHIVLRLTSLELDSPRLSDYYELACDHLLPQFSNLTHLSLGDGSVSALLPVYLHHLSRLTSLRLGPDAHLALDDENLLQLVQGPTRLPSLRHLVLDCFGQKAGRRIRIGEHLDEGSLGEMMKRDGWEAPRLGCFTAEAVTRFILKCERNGVKVGGEAATVVEMETDYDIEFANRSILRSIQLKTLDDLKRRNDRPRFPHNPIDDLDPQNLKLVKTELPEKNWYALSLERGAMSEGTGGVR
ncbi:hypothetical protein JCM5353_004920 [Sporobolomyces roseus]